MQSVLPCCLLSSPQGRVCRTWPGWCLSCRSLWGKEGLACSAQQQWHKGISNNYGNRVVTDTIAVPHLGAKRCTFFMPCSKLTQAYCTNDHALLSCGSRSFDNLLGRRSRGVPCRRQRTLHVLRLLSTQMGRVCRAACGCQSCRCLACSQTHCRLACIHSRAGGCMHWHSLQAW